MATRTTEPEGRFPFPVIEIRPAAPADHPAFTALVRSAGLPLDGLEPALATAVVARDGAAVVACAALELYGDAALLRSVAVAQSRRGEGLGLRISQAALDLARDRGARRVFLLTQTAEGFFPKLGFRRIGREEAQPAVGRSIEFQSVCPASATVMALSLEP
jgi:amino-acid N-acetyltransferase